MEATRSVNPPAPDNPTDTSQPCPPSPVTFWCLVILASAAFVPCVLVPVWEDYRAIRLAESYEAIALANIEQHVAMQKKHINALRTDPAVNMRLAKRDLRYRQPLETTIKLDGLVPPTPKVTKPRLRPIEPPAFLQRVFGRIVRILPRRLFLDRFARTTIMILAGGTMLAAFLLFPPIRSRRAMRINVSIDTADA